MRRLRVLLRALAPAALVLVPLAAAAAGPFAGGGEPIPRGLLSPRGIGGIKAGVATAAALLLALSLGLERTGHAARWRRTRDVALAALGLVGALLWFNLGQFHFPGFGHRSETFHYYLGAKYFPELGYTRLYECTAVADLESGLPPADLARPMRDLETNELTSTAAILADPQRCKAHFSPRRWAAFRHDVGVLRAQVNPRRWIRFQQDHGYNATPVWTALGRALTSTGPASPAQILALQLLDPALLAALWGLVAWAFGWRIAAVGAIYWGTNYVAPFDWTGGSILRQDWLLASVAGIALLRRERPAAAGALLAWATLLRVFPGIVVAGVGLGVVGTLWRERRLAPPRWFARFAAGGAVATALLVPLGALATGGLGSWRDFAVNSRVLLSTPLANHVGLATVLSYDPAQRSQLARDPSLPDPLDPWKRARRARFAENRPLFVALALGFAALVARAGAGQPAWLAAVLGVAAIPVATELTGYYWSVLLALAFAAERRPLMAPALCALSALGWAIASHWHYTDVIHVWLSVATVSFCVFTVLLLTPRAARDWTGAEASSKIQTGA